MKFADVATLTLPLVLTLAGLAVGLLVQRLLLTRLARAASGTGMLTDDLGVSALRGPVILWGTVLGLYLATQVSDFPTHIRPLVQRILVVLLISSVTWTIARMVGALVQPRVPATAGVSESPQLLTNLAKALVMVVGLMVILQTLDIAITPLITALGIGGLAVGLALQDTLANLFAGIHLLVSRQVRRGDFIRLSEGQEGVVQDVTWRYTTIRQLSNVTIVPNAKLASAITANFNLPNQTQAVLVNASVTYEPDLRVVETIALDVAREVMRDVAGTVSGFTPLVRFHTYDDTRIRFSVVLGGRDYVAQYLIKHEFIKRLRERFRQEKIA